MSEYRICVGIDGSPSSIAALKFALEEAAMRNGTVEVVTTWTVEPPYGGYGIGITLEERSRHLRDAEQIQHAAIGEALAGLDAVPKIERKVVHSSRPTPWEALVERAESADLLVVGTEHKGIFKRVVVGSTSSQCVRHSPVPVAVVPHIDPVLSALDARSADEEVAAR